MSDSEHDDDAIMEKMQEKPKTTIERPKDGRSKLRSAAQKAATERML